MTNMDPKKRLKYHQANSGPVMKDLHQWMSLRMDYDPKNPKVDTSECIEPNSGLGKAVRYLLTHWAAALTLFLRHAGAPLDNNVVERALKRAVLRRKNALFYKTLHGAQVGDMFMKLIHTCQLNDANPFDYLVEVQRHAIEVRTNPNLWFPWNYKDQLKPAPD